jgi:glycosyltransferase involved in cell wall biosynthesis
MVGDGEEKPALEAKIRECGLSSAVFLPGRTEDVLPAVAAMDIGVLCSRAESLSNSIIEYMAAGLPCVVSDIGGNLEALGADNGLAFRSGDKNDFIDEVEKLILNPDRRCQLGRRARAYVRNTYDHNVVTRQHERLYEKYLSGGSKE